MLHETIEAALERGCKIETLINKSNDLSGSSKMASVVVGARAGLAFAAGAAGSAFAAPFCLDIICAIGSSSSESLELMVLAARRAARRAMCREARAEAQAASWQNCFV